MTQTNDTRPGDGRYTVHYEPAGEGWWLATVPACDGCLTQGKSLRQTRKRIREALSLFVDDAETAELVDRMKLPAALEKSVEAYREARKAHEAAERAYAKKLAGAAKRLGKSGLSTRDAAEILEISQQRVSQLRAE